MYNSGNSNVVVSPWIFLVYIFVIAVALIVLHIMATLTMNLQEKKGYKAKYWIGFIFGVLAWFYYLAMPDLKTQKALQDIAESLKKDKNN